MKKVILGLLLLLCPIVMIAQNFTVTGTITSANDNTPLPGVSVIIKGTTVGVTSDINGKYSIDAENLNDILVFSFIGMKSQEIHIDGVALIDVVMQTESYDMDEVVVIGYGVTKKAAFTGAASVVDKEKMADKVVSNPINSLEGSVAGLQLNIKSGQPGAPATIYIRGRNSLNSGTQPLYVIDGVPIEAGSWGTRTDEGQEFSPLSCINADDIENITVLKDATATSIYGARAANGVMVITTKQGKAGSKTKISFGIKRGWEELPSYTDDYKTLGKDQYNELQIEGWANYLGVDNATAEDKYYNGSLYGYSLADNGITKENMANVDWMDAITRSGQIQEYNFSIQSSGKSEDSPNLYLSLSYLDNEAYIRGKDFERYSFRLNINQKPIDWVKYGINTSLAYSETNMGAGGGYYSDPITQAMMQSPLTPVKTENGDWNFNTANGYNPVAQRSAKGDKSEQKTWRAIISPYVTLNFTPELFFTSRLGLDFMNINEFGFWSFLQPQGNGMRGMGEHSTHTQTMLTQTNTLNYLKTINDDHHLNLLAGQEISQTNLNTSYLSGSNYPVPDMNVVSLAATPGSAATYKEELRLASFFFNGQYDYKNKYYFSASYRYDGSSRFGDNNQWASFWSVGGKYRISAENFMQSTSDWLDNLMIRASYGTSGNQAVGGNWYASRSLYAYGRNYNSNGGSVADQYGNKDLQWEETAKFNIGLDAHIFSRFDVTLDYYIHKTQDMVFDVPMSHTSGYSSIPQNIGELENKGIELSIKANILNTKDWRWDASLVASKNENEITKLSTDLPIESTTTIIEVGRDIFQFKMIEFAGVDPDTGDALYYLKENGSETTTNYNEAEKRYVGAPTPDLQGSLSTTLKFKNFDFSTQLNYSIGGKIYGNHLRYDENRGNGLNQNTTKYVYENRWKKPGDIAKVPRFEMDQPNHHSSQFLMDGDYLKIKNVVLGYTLPKRWTNSIKCEKIRIYGSVTNLYTFTKSNYRGFDPAGNDADGIQWWNYPTPRTFMFGINVNL